MNRKPIAALTRCFFCGEPDKILLCSPFNARGEPATDMDKLNGKVIDMEPCPKCADLMKQGIMLLTVRDGEKQDNPFRTGRVFVVREDAMKRIVGDDTHAMFKVRWSFIEDSVADKLGLTAAADAPKTPGTEDVQTPPASPAPEGGAS